MELKVEKLIYGGDGLARLPADERGRGKAAFMPFVLEGERIEASIRQSKAGFARARADKIVEPSPYRITPGCPYFLRCGGCHYQHSSYEHQLEIKASIYKENLRRIAKLDLASELKVHASPPWNYRNHTRLRVHTEPEFAIGYFKFGSHELLAVEQCPISSPLINRAIAKFWELGRSGKIVSRIREVEFFVDGEDSQLLIELYAEMESSEAQRRAEELLAQFTEAVGISIFPSSATENGNKAAEACAIAGVRDISYKTAAATYRVSAGAFFQSNRYLIDKLVEIVTGGRTGRTALDLYAGVGLFSVVLSREFERVIAVESSQQSAADLAYNAPVSVKTVRCTVEEYLKNGGGQADLIVVDPPRGGLGETVARSVAELKAPRLTYVSCDPATLARDLVVLAGAGYRIEEAHLVDLFPQTFHLESVLQLVR